LRLAVLALVAACSPRFDLDEPIEILISDELELENRIMVANAASCWEQEFDIQFVVTETITGANYLTVVLDELTCVSLEGDNVLSMGRYFAGRPAKISLCPYGVRDELTRPADYYFRVILHELGHASGIYGEGREPYSVMGSAQHIYGGTRVFSEEDHALLADAVGPRTGTCTPAIVFGPQGTSCRCPY
jgi:hypothetical protein